MPGFIVDLFRMRVLQGLTENHNIVEIYRRGKSVIMLNKLLSVGFFKLSRKNVHIVFQRFGIFVHHHIIALFKQVGRYRKCEQAAPVHCVLYCIGKRFTGDEVLVIPDCDIAAKRRLMNKVHQPLRRFPVLLAVAEEDIRVKGVADLLRPSVSRGNAV